MPHKDPEARKLYAHNWNQKNKRRQKRWMDLSEAERVSRRRSARDHFRSLTPDQRTHRALISNYGISLDDKRRMFAAQNGACAICQTKFVDERAAHVDHDHTNDIHYKTPRRSGRLRGKCKADAVRGLLCSKCNNGLGSFLDDIEHLASAIIYLIRSRK